MKPSYTPEEFKQAQQALGLSDSQAAEMLGVSEQHIRRLKTRPEANQHRAVNETVARLVNAYRDGYRPADWPE